MIPILRILPLSFELILRLYCLTTTMAGAKTRVKKATGQATVGRGGRAGVGIRCNANGWSLLRISRVSLG